MPGEWGHVWEGTSLAVLDRADGQILWTRPAQEGFHYHALALADGTLFSVESPSRVRAKKTDETTKPAAPWQPPLSTLLALDARSGKTRWLATTANRNYADPEAHTAGIRDSDDWLGYCPASRNPAHRQDLGDPGLRRANGARCGTRRSAVGR